MNPLMVFVTYFYLFNCLTVILCGMFSRAFLMRFLCSYPVKRGVLQSYKIAPSPKLNLEIVLLWVKYLWPHFEMGYRLFHTV